MAADVTVRAVLLSNQNLSGTFTTQDNVVLVNGDRVLVPRQNAGTDNDIYTVGSPWVRDTGVNLFRWMDILVSEGTEYAGSKWTLSTASTIVRDGSMALHFAVREKLPIWELGPGLEAPGGFLRTQQFDNLQGAYVFGTNRATLSSGGNIIAVESTGEQSRQTLMEGGLVEYLSANSVRVRPGETFAPGAGPISWNEPIDKTGLVLTTSNWHYLYAYLADGVAAIEVSVQRPASPYFGAARVKGGGTGGVLDNTNPDTEPDTTRR